MDTIKRYARAVFDSLVDKADNHPTVATVTALCLIVASFVLGALVF